MLSIYRATGKYTQMPRAMHLHKNTIELVLIENGYGVHIIDGKKYYTEKGDLLIFNAGMLHDESSAGNVNLTIITCAATNLKILGLPPNTLILKNQTPIIKTGKLFFQIKHLFKVIYRAISQNESHSTEFSNYIFYALIIMLYEITQKNVTYLYTKEENQLAKKIKSHIDNNYMHNLKLEELAECIHVNIYYLSHIFKKVYGQSPIQYIMRRRIGEAQTLLIDTNKNITDIAMTVGYNSQSYFNVAFVKITGMSPKKYRILYSKI